MPRQLNLYAQAAGGLHLNLWNHFGPLVRAVGHLLTLPHWLGRGRRRWTAIGWCTGTRHGGHTQLRHRCPNIHKSDQELLHLLQLCVPGQTITSMDEAQALLLRNFRVGKDNASECASWLTEMARDMLAPIPFREVFVILALFLPQLKRSRTCGQVLRSNSEDSKLILRPLWQVSKECMNTMSPFPPGPL